MRAIRLFLVAWLVCSAALLAFAAITSGLGGGSDDPARWGRWIAGALMVGAFPAGAVAHRDVLAWRGPWLAPLARFGIATILAAVLVFLVRGYIGPALAEDVPGEPATWSLTERVEALTSIEDRAVSAGTLEAWSEVNRIGWEVDVTVVSALTTIALAWIGALLAGWLPRDLRQEVRLAVLLGAGVFFLMTGYLMTENGYEQLLVRTVGPAYVTAWFPLLAPGMAAAGLLVATLCRLAGGGVGDGDPA